jgi:predicted DNA-binding transcriptional regulator AlpA
MAKRIDPDDLVDATEVAELLGLAHRNSVSVYRKRHDDFPEPVVTKSRCLLWLRADVEAWAVSRT